ncbi:MAG: hypothetical protein QOF52_2477 [Propionibacteriaceae bacterium]|nr:hypothetical protein [Propionibacteriaceae bacterium]
MPSARPRRSPSQEQKAKRKHGKRGPGKDGKPAAAEITRAATASRASAGLQIRIGFSGPSSR